MREWRRYTERNRGKKLDKLVSRDTEEQGKIAAGAHFQLQEILLCVPKWILKLHSIFPLNIFST
jgi:hypothetical protein